MRRRFACTSGKSQTLEPGLLSAEVCGGAPSIGINVASHGIWKREERAADDMPALSQGIEIVFSTGTVIEAASNKRLKSVHGPREDILAKGTGREKDRPELSRSAKLSWALF